MAQLNYTVGNWTVVSNEVDTISTPKSLQAVDIDYAHDYSVAAQTAGRTELLNVSGTTLEPVERIRYTKGVVDNIYHGLDIPDAARTGPRKGVAGIVEACYFLNATNDVSGEFWVPVMRMQFKVETITHNVITKDALDWALKRFDGHLRGTGGSDSSLLLALLRGDTDPTK